MVSTAHFNLLLDWSAEDGYRSKDSEVVVGQVA